MNISQLEEQVKKIGNVMMSKSYYQNLMDELKEYRENLNNKVVFSPSSLVKYIKGNSAFKGNVHEFF